MPPKRKLAEKKIEEKNNAEGDHKKLKVEAKPTRGRAAKMLVEGKDENTETNIEQAETKPKRKRVVAEKVESENVEEKKEAPQKKGKGAKKETAKKNNAEPDNATKKNNDGGDVKTKAKPKKGGAAKKEKNESEEEMEEEPTATVSKTTSRATKKKVNITKETEMPNRVSKDKRNAIKENLKEENDEEIEKTIKNKKAANKIETKPGKKEAHKEDKPALVNETSTTYSNMDLNCFRKNAKNEKSNFKISSWNVGGIRAWIKKNGLEYVEKESPDILCLQEIKCDEANIPEELKNNSAYKLYSCASKKDGYAGVALLSKIPPINITYGIDCVEQDAEGRCITAEYEEFYVICAYVPNAGRKLVTLPKRLDWNDHFKMYVKELDKKKPVIICGDMNVAHNEIDLKNPKTNRKNAGFTDEERVGMTEFLEEGFVDTFRKLYPEKEDAFTFWSYFANSRAKNVGWRLDYFIVSERFMDSVCDNIMRNEIFGSDHCPITLFLRK